MNFNLFLSIVLAGMITCCSCHKPDGGNGVVPEEEKEASCMVSFERDGSSEFFNIALRDEFRKDIWFVFRLNHYINHSSLQYMDLWRIDWAYQGRFDEKTGTMENILDRIITDGESESVFKDYGENLNVQGQTHIDTYDFTGGYHGDERIDLDDRCGAVFYIDGEALAEDRMKETFGWVKCGSFHYVQKSTMHKTALKVDGKAVESDHHVVAEHVKTTVFGDSGYRTDNRLTMRDEIDFYWYLGICCVGRTVAEKGCSDDMKTVSFDASGVNRLEAVGKSEYRAWSDSNSIEVYVKSTLTEGGDDGKARMHIWDNRNYAKYYRRYPANGAYRTSDGEVFASTMTVKFTSR
jgi:hypothetical protein